MNLLKHIIRPARGGAAGVVVVFTLLLTVCAYAGLLGLPLALILFSWYFKYCFILFDHVVRGFDDPPALDIQMVNPWSEFRPLAQLIILLTAVGLLRVAALKSVLLAGLLGLPVALAFPASIAILALEGNLFKAVYPPALLRLISGLGARYWAACGVIAAISALLALSARLGLWPPLEIALSLFAYLSIYSTLAGAVYDRRHDLGLTTWASPERTEALRRAADEAAGVKLVTEAYGQLRARKPAEAWATLETWLESRGRTPEDCRWLRDAVLAWPDPRYAIRLTEEYVEALLTAKRAGEALDAVRDRLRVDPHCRPRTAASTLAVARLAALGGGAPAVARTLLGDFAARFPGDPLLEPARELARHLGE